MKASIEVASRQEADAIRAGIDDAELRAMVSITGTLTQLQEASRQRVLKYVNNRFSKAQDQQEMPLGVS